MEMSELVTVDKIHSMSTTIVAASWNVSAVNTNPFEYWVTHSDPAYNALMFGIQSFVDSPESDVHVHQIFTDAMFSELIAELEIQGIAGGQELQTCWEQDYRQRMAVRDFLKNAEVGVKRLVSLPDRITNTIYLPDGNSCLRPTVINAFDGCSLSSIAIWWREWKKFMFHTWVQICTGDNMSADTAPQQLVCSLIGPISRSKYPAVTAQEQAISIPLQILCLAIMDSILIHIVNEVAPTSWQDVRRSLCEALIDNKQAKTCAIMASYTDVDIFFVQEAAAAFTEHVRKNEKLNQKYFLLIPHNLDGKRDQNSLILVDRQQFKDCSVVDVTDDVLDLLDGDWVAAGDLVAVSVEDAAGRRYLLASFHGDSNGLSTQPVLQAIANCARGSYDDHTLLLGLDANTHSTVKSTPGATLQQGLADFLRFVEASGLMASSESLSPDPLAPTTCNSRTFLQTQMNKATPFRQRAAHPHLKDWLLAFRSQTRAVTGACRDNTGCRRYDDGVVFPTLDFPSDHALISATFHLAADPPPQSGSAAPHGPLEAPSAAQSDAAARPPSSRRHASPATGGSLFGSMRITSVRSAFGLSPGTSSTGSSSNLRGKSLYDYWGISESPLDQTRWAFPAGNDEPAMPHGGADGGGGADEATKCTAELRALCEQHFVRMAVQPRGFDLDESTSVLSTIEDRSIWIVVSSRPYSAGICKAWFRAVIASAAALYLLSAVLNLLPAAGTDFSGTAFRFTPSGVRGGGPWGRPGAGVHSVGLLRDGCRLGAAGNSTESAASVTLWFDQAVSANGWWFATSADRGEQDDPVIFQVEHSTDGTTWSTVEYPPWMLRADVEDVPRERRAHKSVDLRASWQWIAQNACACVQSACYIASCVLGALGRGRAAALWTGFSFLLMALVAAGIALYDVCQSASPAVQTNSAYFWVQSISQVCIAAGIWHERYVLDVFVVAVTVFGVTSAINLVQNRIDFRVQLSLVMFIAGTALPIFLGVALILLRRSTRRWALNVLAQQDRQVYEGLWKSLIIQGQYQRSFAKLDTVVKRISKSLPAGPVLQRHRAVAEGEQGVLPSHLSSTVRLLSDASMLFRDAAAGEGPCVASLEQLFNQAAFVDVVLRKKSKEWALESKGCFWVSVDGGSKSVLRRWEDIQADGAQGTVQWAQLKPHARALEKLLRSYECEVARLLDCCRQTIYFEEADEMRACLEWIAQDPDVEILRIKNRFKPDYDSRWTAGHRNVVVSLRIRCRETRSLGVDMHICELKLTLTAFAVLKTEERHRQYLVLRNCRGAPSFTDLMYTAAVNLSNCLAWRCSRKARRLGKKASVVPVDEELGICAPLACMTTYSGLSTGTDNGKDGLNDSMAGDQKIHELSQSFPAGDQDTGESSCEAFPFDMSYMDIRQEVPFPPPKPEQAVLELPNVAEPEDLDQCERMKMIVQQVRASMTRHLPFGLYKNKLMSDAVLRADSGSLWDTSHPLAAALCKPWFAYMLCAFALGMLVNLALSLSIIVGDNVVDGYHFRFTPLELRGGASLPVTTPGIGSFGVMLHGCDVQSGFNVSVVNASMVLSFSKSVGMNGWWFTTAEQPLGYDPVGFCLESSSDVEGLHWRGVGSSSAEWTWAGIFLVGSGRYDTPTSRGHRVDFDMQVPWQFSTVQLGNGFVVLVMIVSLGAAAATNNHMLGKSLLSAGFLCCCIFNLVAAGAYLADGQVVAALVPGANGIVGSAAVLLLMTAERYTGRWAAPIGVAYLATVAVYAGIHGSAAALLGDGRGIFINASLSVGLNWLSIAVHYLLAGRASTARAQAVVEADKAAYDQCWAAVVQADAADPGGSNLARIQELIATVSAGLPRQVLQRGRAAHLAGGVAWGSDGSDGPSSLASAGSSAHSASQRRRSSTGSQLTRSCSGLGAPIVCLDQLFLQAHGLDLFLRDKVQQWALAAGGCFPVKSCGSIRASRLGRSGLSFEPWATIVQNPARRERVRWPGVKSSKRAIEKLYRSNDLEVARLLDCCRASIFFDDPAGVLACLECVSRDREVRLARVKNRLDPAHDAAATAGFRNVCMNLRIVSEETVRLGLEAHVCEVQLVLVSFAKLSTEEGHQRYKIWRNVRGQ